MGYSFAPYYGAMANPLADVVGNAVLVMQIATGDTIDTVSESDQAIVARARKGGLNGGKARTNPIFRGLKRTLRDHRKSVDAAAMMRVP